MAKIIIEKNEAVADLIERILESEEEEITLVVPKRSHLLDSPSNFRLIAREAEVLGKSLTVESVDESALELAKGAGLRVTHPLFDEKVRDGEAGAPAFSDILPAALRRKTKGKAQKAVPLRVEREEDFTEEEPVDEAMAHGEAISGNEYAEAAEEAGEEAAEERYDTLSDYTEAPRSRKWVLAGFLTLALLLIGGWVAAAMFGTAEVVIRFNESPWSFDETVTALTSVKDVDASRNVIPGQYFEEKKSLVQSVPASGRATVSDKARGMLTIVNNYGTDAQTLVERTRFETPDGKVFRLDSTVVVPGATRNGDKLTPASIKAAVTADKAGPEYNVGKVDRLVISAWKGTPKGTGFYGILPDGTSGGFIGERPVASEADVASAKSKINDLMKAAFQTTFLTSIPSEIKVLEKASAYELGAITQGRSSGDGVAVTAEALFRAFGFREKDAAALLGMKAEAVNGSMHLEDLALTYASPAVDFGRKQLTFRITAEGRLAPDFDREAFAKSIFGKSEAETRAALTVLPELANAEVRLWPAWLRRVPDDLSKVKVTVE